MSSENDAKSEALSIYLEKSKMAKEAKDICRCISVTIRVALCSISLFWGRKLQNDAFFKFLAF